MKFSTIFVAASSMASTVLSAPALGKPFTQTFDKQKITAGTGAIVAPTSPNLGLKFTGFGIESKPAGINLGLQAHSEPNNLFYSVNTALLHGASPVIATAAADEVMQIHSMYAGCSTDALADRVPTACTIVCSVLTESGLRKSTTFRYAAQPSMIKVNFPPLLGKIKSVSFSTIPPEDGTAQTMDTLIDSFSYTLYKK